MKKEEGRRQKEKLLMDSQRRPLRVYKPQTILSTSVDGGVLNPPQKI
ncbi:MULTISPECIES: hypothetical protein [Okeania]|nr:hypothetical protein [Okeania sp. SIO1F9]NET79268.1 hypothetical protein [Okeania sp. SIO1F9]